MTSLCLQRNETNRETKYERFMMYAHMQFNVLYIYTRTAIELLLMILYYCLLYVYYNYNHIGYIYIYIATRLSVPCTGTAWSYFIYAQHITIFIDKGGCADCLLENVCDGILQN